MESSLNKSHSSTAQMTNPFKELNETTFLDPTLSEDQLLAIIEEEANRGCRSPDEVLQLIDENTYTNGSQQYSNQENSCLHQNDSIGKAMALPAISNLLSTNSFSAMSAQLDQSNYVQNFTNFANQNAYLPYLPMNLYQQMLVEQATQNHMVFVNNLNTPAGVPLNYNQNLDSYIEAVFDDNPPKNSYFSDFNSKERQQQNIQHEIVAIQSQTEVQSQSESKQKGDQLFQPKENIHQNRIECEERLYQLQAQKSDSSNLGLISINQSGTEISNKNILMPINQNDFNSYSRASQKTSKCIDIGKSAFHPYINRRGTFKKIENNQKNLYLMPNTVNENFTNNPFQYIVPPLNEVPVQSPLQTKQSYILSSNTTLPSSGIQVEMLEKNFQNQTFIVQQEDYFSKLNYLDPSDIVITRIKTPEEPLHKKRKQQLEILKNCEITFEEPDASDLITITTPSLVHEPENIEIDEEIPLSKLRIINSKDYLKALIQTQNKLHSIAEQNTEFESLKNPNCLELSNVEYGNQKKFTENSLISSEEKSSMLLRSTKPDAEISFLNQLQQKQKVSREIGNEIVKLGKKIINNNTFDPNLEKERSILSVIKPVSTADPKSNGKRNRKNMKRRPSLDNQVKDKFSEKEKTVMKKKNIKSSLPSEQDQKGLHVINILKRKMEINISNENRKRTRLQIKRQIESESQNSDSKRKK